MGKYQKGAAKERKYAEILRASGWVVIRAAGSHGEADLVALKDRRVCLIQVKSDQAGPFAHFGPDHREALIADAVKAGGEPWLVHWPSGQKFPDAIHPSDWPSASRSFEHACPPHEA